MKWISELQMKRIMLLLSLLVIGLVAMANLPETSTAMNEMPQLKKLIAFLDGK